MTSRLASDAVFLSTSPSYFQSLSGHPSMSSSLSLMSSTPSLSSWDLLFTLWSYIGVGVCHMAFWRCQEDLNHDLNLRHKNSGEHYICYRPCENLPTTFASGLADGQSQTVCKRSLVHGRKVIIHWPHVKFLPLINRSVNQPPEVIIHC